MLRPKERLRARLAPATWVRLRAQRRRLRGGVSSGAAGVVAAAVRMLPAAVVVRVRDGLKLHRPLDYPGARLQMVVSSPTELEVRLRSCEKEPETVEWLETTFEAGDVLYDVGANVGAYSLVASAVSGGKGVVYAFEPGPSTYASLVENIELNHLGGVVTPMPVAVGDVTGIVSFGLHSHESGDASHAGLGGPETNESLRILSLRLDDVSRVLAAPPPTHLKIDVDGGESRVLEGATSTLASPTLRSILVEIEEDRSRVDEIRAIICGAGFELRADVMHFGSRTHNWIFERV